jgi:hypothetical protein
MLEGLKPPSKEASCAVTKRAETLSKEDKQALQEALLSPFWSHEALALELTNRGFVISKDPIRRHRKGLCNCAK